MLIFQRALPSAMITGRVLSLLRAEESQAPIERRLASKNKSVDGYAALVTLPDFIHRVQTFIRPLPPAGS
jgi:hypothetical protein